MTYKVIHNALVNKVQTQAICNCRITARAVIWSTSYFPNVSIFLLTALGGLPENSGIRKVWAKRDVIHKRSDLKSEETKKKKIRASVGRFKEIEGKLYL